VRNLKLLATVAVSGLMAVTASFAADRDSGVALSVRAPVSERVALLESYDLVALDRVYFNSGALHPKEGQLASLSPLLARAASLSGSMIELRAYADGGASTVDDMKMSTLRAEAVARFLRSQGIASNRIVVVPIGAVDPTGRASEAEHQRVDIRLFAPPAE
jgi:outer membrane protein OmpA-like peptidoglycan-associated protein